MCGYYVINATKATMEYVAELERIENEAKELMKELEARMEIGL